MSALNFMGTMFLLVTSGFKWEHAVKMGLVIKLHLIFKCKASLQKNYLPKNTKYLRILCRNCTKIRKSKKQTNAPKDANIDRQLKYLNPTDKI